MKLDGGLFRNMLENPKALRILEKQISIFHDIGAKVVIEGVETASAMRAALNAGADMLQGFHFGQPTIAPIW